MQQSYSSRAETADGDRDFDLVAHYYGILKRRFLYFVVPFSLVLITGVFIVLIQRPIFLAEGKILVESQEIPTELVRPTVTAVAQERIQVIQQRLMARDNLLAIVNKFGIFSAEREWMSGTQLLDLMRARAQIKVLDAELPIRSNNVAIVFTVSFEHEIPDIALRVANEFVTMILSEDARNRTNRAMETTKFLAKEVKRLESELGSTEAQISEIKRRPSNAVPEQVLTQLATLKADFLQKSSVYSKTHPDLKALKQKIAALEQVVGQAPQVENGTDALERQQESIEKDLEDATRKLAAARLGESLERDQESERLLILEQPTLPQKPFKPNRLKLLTMAFGLAGMIGAGAVFAAEAMDKSIRSSQELLGLVEGQMIVAIPYISTRAEDFRKKRKLVSVVALLLALAVSGLAAVFVFGPSVDLSSFDTLLQSTIDALRRLSK